MLETELIQLVKKIQLHHAELQIIELKAAAQGCPTRLYDTLSSFSNQDDGGIIVFGVDERRDYEVVGVYDVQDLMKHVVEQCNQMHPKVRAVFTVCRIDDRNVVSAEIPALDIADRPCFYEGRGRYRGSYVRVGDADEPMTEYEVYSYEAFRRKYEDELRAVDRATVADLDSDQLLRYTLALKDGRPNLARMDQQRVLELMSIVKDNHPTLAGMMLFGLYPQAFLPQVSIVATRLPGTTAGEGDVEGARFVDNMRIEGTLSEQLQGTLAFVRRNMRTKTIIDTVSGNRVDHEEYPIEAVRELVLNALIHRDYSIHTQGMPIQVQMFSDRLVITNPGGLYGRLTVDQLGRVQPDTRNPVIATAMELLKQTENRYSGIPTVRRLVAEAGMPEPEFENRRGEFRVTLRLNAQDHADGKESPQSNVRCSDLEPRQRDVLDFCSEPRTRSQIAEHLGIVSTAYAMNRYVYPLVERGLLELGIPDKPASRRQTYRTAE